MAEAVAPRTTDLVVVLPGIMGSTLCDASGHEVWGTSAGALVRGAGSLGRTVKRLRLPEGLGDGPAPDGVTPGCLMPDVHALPGIWTPVKGYDPLVRRLESLGFRETPAGDGAPAGNLLLVPYDWRLSNRRNGQRLKTLVEPALDRWRAKGGQYADAQVVLVCHSMGGLVARWYLERCGGAEICRKLITLGTPYRGAARAVEQLVNGVRKGLGPLNVNLDDFARSLPSLHQLLPDYACVVSGTGLKNLRETAAPGLGSEMVGDAMRFHRELAEAEALRPAGLDATHAIVGARQPTCTTVSFDVDGRAVEWETIDGHNDYGDATVPLVGAVPGMLSQDSNRLRRVVDQHGNLQRNTAALDELEEVLTAFSVRRRAVGQVALRVGAPDYLVAGETLHLVVDLDDESARHGLRVTVRGESGRIIARGLTASHGHAESRFDDLAPGAYDVEVGGVGVASPVTTVTATTLVVAPQD